MWDHISNKLTHHYLLITYFPFLNPPTLYIVTSSLRVTTSSHSWGSCPRPHPRTQRCTSIHRHHHWSRYIQCDLGTTYHWRLLWRHDPTQNDMELSVLCRVCGVGVSMYDGLVIQIVGWVHWSRSRVDVTIRLRISITITVINNLMWLWYMTDEDETRCDYTWLS